MRWFDIVFSGRKGELPPGSERRRPERRTGTVHGVRAAIRVPPAPEQTANLWSRCDAAHDTCAADSQPWRVSRAAGVGPLR